MHRGNKFRNIAWNKLFPNIPRHVMTGNIPESLPEKVKSRAILVFPSFPVLIVIPAVSLVICCYMQKSAAARLFT